MVIFSARFAVLACLCAALSLALPVPVDAAHLGGSHSREKHVSSHPHHPTRSASPTATHSHDGKHHEHKAPQHRAPELPPLLRRYRLHDRILAQNIHGKDHRDHSHRKGLRSAFARSRYRRETGFLSRRSSVYLPGEHGDTYIVSGTPSRSSASARMDSARRSPNTYDRRQVDESDLVLGRVDIMVAAQSVGSMQRLASLALGSTPIDWTSGQSTTKAFPLNASTTNQTQFIMMAMDEPSNAGGSFDKHVTLATEVFDASSAEMVMYCATYDPDPGSISALLMTPCTGATQSTAPADDAADPCSDTASDASSSNLHQSQIFSYDPASGKLEPISAAASPSDVDNGSDDLTTCAGAGVRRDNSNSTTSGSTKPSSTSTSTAPTVSPSQQARNVTLVYVAGAPEVPASSPSISSTTSMSIGQAAMFTTTITTTVVATVTASSPTSRSVTPAQAAVSISASTTPSRSTTATPTRVTSSVSSPSLSLPSSVPAITTSKVPANADESLEVEIVGVTPSTTGSSSSTSTIATTTSSSSSYSSTSTSLDAQAVASSIANAMAHARRRALHGKANTH